LIADKSSKEILDDGTVRLNDFTYTGMGFLLDNPPAYKNADVFDFARKIKGKVEKYNTKELIFANQILETCDDILATNHPLTDDDMPTRLFLVTSSDDRHFHVAEIDFDGNGKTISGHGDGKHVQPHLIVNWQIQVAKNAEPETGEHAHRILNEIMASIKKHISKKHLDRDPKKKKKKDVNINKLLEQKGGNQSMNNEDTKKVEELRAELGDFAKDVSDEDLLNDEKVEELRQAKADSEKEADKSEEKSEEKKANEEEEEKKDDDKKEDKDAKITELEKENKELKATNEAKNSEIEKVRENAEKIGKLKVELADNPHTKDFSDEDYLNDEKVEKAKLQKDNDDLKVERDKLKEDNEKLNQKKKSIKLSKLVMKSQKIKLLIKL